MSRENRGKQALSQQLSLVARALGGAARFELLDVLAQGERTVETLAAVSGRLRPTRQSISSSCIMPAW